MILPLNHCKVRAAAVTQGVIEAVYALVEEGLIDQGQFPRLQVELDWIQYKANFREAVIATQGYDAFGQRVPIMDVHVDARQVVLETLHDDLLLALRPAQPTSGQRVEQDCGRLPLEEFQSLRSSIVWDFNRFFWRHLLAWEAATGK